MDGKRQIGLVLLLWASLQAPLVFGQQAYTIVGSVQTFHGELPDRPILVTLQFRNNTIATTFTDSEGKFSFSELSPNIYRLAVDDEKYRPAEVLVQVNPLLNGMNMARIQLIPRESAGASSPSPGSNPNMVNSAEFTKQIPKPALKEFNKGTNADKDGRIDDAIAHYQKAVSLAPEFYAARNNLGSAYLGKSQFDAAQEQFEKVIQTNPSDAAAYFNLGNLFLLTQKYQDAVRWLEQGLSKEPNSALGHFLLGSLHMRTGNIEQAEKELQTSLQLDPKMLKAHLALVNLFLQRGRPADAVAELKIFLKASPNDPFAPKAREVLHRLEGKAAKTQTD
jgi:Flp pilus assembly protein TadD